MTKPDDLPAAEVFAVIAEPTTPKGAIGTFFDLLLTPWKQNVPGITQPVVVARATGKKVSGSMPVMPGLFENMQADLETMTAREFHNRYLDT